VTANERRKAGFTIVELVITLAVLMVAMMIASGLLLEAIRIFSASGREQREPSSELALRLLREDIRTSAPITDGGGTSLVCRRPDRTDIWELAGDRLMRRGVGPLGEDLGSRPMLDRVQVFSWSAMGGGLVRIQVTRRRPAWASSIRAPTSAWRSVSETAESATLLSGSRLQEGS
jgi:hypothetical protein